MKESKGMKGTMTLRNPIKIDGKEVKELAYDAEKITSEDFFDACTKAGNGNGLVGGASLIEKDHKAHLYFGFYAIVRANKNITIEDLQRVTGFDLVTITNIGTLFTLGLENQTEETSDETSEPIPEGSPSAPTKSGKKA